MGRELPAAEFIRQRLGGLDVEQNQLGSLTLTLGSGEPKRLFVAQLDEPGYVVSRIQEDGYLRLSALGRGYRGTLWAQYHEGQKIVIATAEGLVRGGIGIPSSHLGRFREDTNEPFRITRAYVDVGAESREEVEELGIGFLDPVTLVKRPTILRNEMIACPSSQTKAAAIALVDAARRLAASDINGTVVLAWTVLESLNRKGLESVVLSHGPFAEAYLFSRNFGFSEEERRLVPASLPSPGSGVLVAGPVAVNLPGTTRAPHVEPRPGSSTGGPDWGDADVGYLGVPSRYQDTPVEIVSLKDVQALSDAFVQIAGGDVQATTQLPELPQPPRWIETSRGHERVAGVLASLVSEYGVSRAEEPVRKRVEALLPNWPNWMNPSTDEMGNMAFTFGKGEEHYVFVAHMDEVGFTVESILEDGRLQLGRRSSPWESQAALVHTGVGDVESVFEPREGYFSADVRRPPEPLTVYLGTNSREETEALGVEAGKTTVTMPKEMQRMGRHRVLARGLDDRAGCAALILAAERINPDLLTRRVTFAWSVEEEIGLNGAEVLARRLTDATMVFPVDTFVSSDSPLEWDGTAYCPLGQGAVIRVLESSNFSPRSAVTKLLGLAKAGNIDVQLGMTSGGTDGQPFMVNDTVDVPLSWPGRNSHSPVEVGDFRDMESLIELVLRIAMK